MNMLSCNLDFKNLGNSLRLKCVYEASWVLDCIKSIEKNEIFKQTDK